MPSRIVKKTAPVSASSVMPCCQTIAAQIPAVASSTSGYIGEIGSLQLRHLPRSSSHETTGMLSHGRSPTAQRGQRDGGRTTDCFGSAPQRRMQTLRKLPSTAPSSPA